jgi:DNA repair protein RecN (Recombination protein N)
VLRELHVRNLAVLAEASVEFGEGLNVLTGETGAGKSIVVDSLNLLAGARAAHELIRTGAETLSVAGVFTPGGDGWRRLLGEAGIEAEGDEVLARREIGRSGRNRVFVNDQPTTLRLLADLAPHLLRIHGQREELGLVDPELQRRWLDASGGEGGAELLDRTAAAYERWVRLAGRLERLSGDERLRVERLDLARFQASELAAAGLAAGEETALRAERDVLRHGEAIARALGGSVALLFDDEGAAVDRLARSQALLAEVAEWEPQAAAWDGELAELRARVEEAAAALRRRLDGLEADPRRLDEVEERLAALERLFRKHRVTTAAELVARRAELEAEIAELAGDVADRDEVERQAAAALEIYRIAALELSARRRAWGKSLAAAIEAELGDLGLGKARLGVELLRRAREGSPLVVDGEAVEFGRRGVDQVVIEFAPNPGEAPRPLSLIASGGELSRIYLALQLAVRAGGGDGGPTLVFDEVDSGIGGAQAAALGKKLQRLGRAAQVLVVTHLPQVASFAHRHFRVEKKVHAGRTRTGVAELDAPGRAAEIARMLGGERVTPLSLSHARELLAAAAPGRTAPVAPAPPAPPAGSGRRSKEGR